MTHMRILFAQLLLLLSFNLLAAPDENTFPSITLKANDSLYSVEYANTFELRAQGLMHRTSMCDNCGMLFHFERAKIAGMWMKNTLIPLDIAFIRKDGTITDIKTMQPHDLSTTSSSEPVVYAWEMNLDWFKQNAIKVGDKVSIPEVTK